MIGLVGKSSLLGKRLTFVGFCFDKHPLDPTLQIQMSVYRLDKKAHVLCLSEVADPDVEGAKEGLGGEVFGEDIAPYAVRLMEGQPIETVSKMLAESKPDTTFHWVSTG